MYRTHNDGGLLTIRADVIRYKVTAVKLLLKLFRTASAVGQSTKLKLRRIHTYISHFKSHFNFLYVESGRTAQ